ncbi:hypothetical protein AAL_06166 [Moelleriella libera RCEF 2490]|uniref:Arginase-like protein n=1 Tax=Moelleriella libera RCEF 2490 TaxID=1081109 RepID=A0A166NUR1_9HYPO|nr:hypothetical protein AAL_06166 [Moelleriella libera RCEF 2490]
MAAPSTWADGHTRHVSRVRTYNWPPYQLNFWIFVMLFAAASIVGVFASFVQIQQQLDLPIPWYFPYNITVGTLALVFIGGVFLLIANRRLLPAIVMLGALMMLVLWLVGLVVVAVQLFGPTGSVQSTCDLQVFTRDPRGATQETLAWLQQRNICQSWQFAFAMALIGSIFLLWIMVMAYQVFVDS